MGSRVDADAARALLAAVAAGDVAVDAAMERLVSGVLGDGDGFSDLGFARVDTHRALRTGDPEVIYAAGKTPEQVTAICDKLHSAHPDRAVLITRADDAVRAALRDAFGVEFTEEAAGRIAAVGPVPGAAAGPVPADASPVPAEMSDPATTLWNRGPTDRPQRRHAREPGRHRPGKVTVVCAGTSDLPVAVEAAFTARVCGAEVTQVTDVGVAGIHRLLAARPVLSTSDCVVVVAGMDGALPSAVGGMVGVPIIAVPTSVGYGASFGGLAALLTMLNSCAPGVTVVNIDNGFGAGIAAARIVRKGDRD